jgi:hypothetical protein
MEIDKSDLSTVQYVSILCININFEQSQRDFELEVTLLQRAAATTSC